MVSLARQLLRSGGREFRPPPVLPLRGLAHRRAGPVVVGVERQRVITPWAIARGFSSGLSRDPGLERPVAHVADAGEPRKLGRGYTVVPGLDVDRDLVYLRLDREQGRIAFGQRRRKPLV